ncbi:transcription elongation factor GreA [Sodalis glossinidius]|nr:transcription elongation factor GreA [Sodalis glossinidius]
MVRSDKARLIELQQDYSVKDLWDFLEMIAVESHNHAAWQHYSEVNHGRR